MTSPGLPEFLLARYAEDQERYVKGSRQWAECEAKRRIVTTQQSLASFDRYPDVDYTGIDAELSRLDWVCHLLALPYADHPDYDESWRP